MNTTRPASCTPHQNPFPHELLGLPDPSTVQLEDPCLLKVYREFCSCLHPGSSEGVVAADPEFFIFDSRSVDSESEALTRMKLLCALLRPTKSYLKRIVGRTYDTESFWNTQGRFSGHVYNFGIIKAIKCLETFRGTADYRTLRKPAISFRYLDCLSSELPTAPGITWLAKMEMCTWSREWGIALHYGDSEDNQDNAFPKVVGFFRMDGYPRTAAALITECDYCYIYEEAMVFGDGLLALCWKRGGDSGEICLGRELLELDDLTLARLRRDYSGFNNHTFLSDVETIQAYAGEELDIFWPESSLKPVFDRLGYEGVMKVIAEVRERQRKMRESELARQIELDRRRMQQTQQLYESVSPLSPEEFPHDLTVMDLSRAQRQSLRKWMQEKLMLRDCFITTASRYAGTSLIITFVDDRGRETREFRKKDDGYPTVQEAFRQLFASFYEQHACPVCNSRDTYWIEYLFDDDDDEGREDDTTEETPPQGKFYAHDNFDRFLGHNERWQVKLRYDEVNGEDTIFFEIPLFHCGVCGHNWRD